MIQTVSVIHRYVFNMRYFFLRKVIIRLYTTYWLSAQFIYIAPWRGYWWYFAQIAYISADVTRISLTYVFFIVIIPVYFGVDPIDSFEFQTGWWLSAFPISFLFGRFRFIFKLHFRITYIIASSWTFL